MSDSKKLQPPKWGKCRKNTSPEEMVCLIKKHERSSPIKDQWMDYHGDSTFYYHKCERCDIEVKHLNKDCPSCKPLLGGCRCGGAAEEEHSCPYAEEMGGDSGLCNCCSSCTSECAMDV